jgi:anti-sigma factor RsiW
MMECDQMSTWIDAYIDRELESDRASQLEAHVSSCGRCTASVEERRQLKASVTRAALHRPAPASLRESFLRDPAVRPAKLRAPAWAYAALAACLVLASALALQVARAPASSLEATVMHEAVSSHIRSLMASHLADVASTDQHTVKPWFAGKVDFSPLVVDHTAEGFPLTGGRLDYVAGRPVAALVYTRRAHVINLFTCPDALAKPSPSVRSQDRGYNAATWSDGAMRYCAVTDASADELANFVRLVGTEPAK